jgi:large subunit ribosomal protein L5
MADTQEKEKKQKAPKGEPKGKQKAAKPEPAVDTAPAEPAPPARLRAHYEQRVRPALQQQFGFANPHQIPKLLKIVLNVGMGDAQKNPKSLEAAVAELGAITGQRPVVTRAKKSIAIFKLRAGQKIGAMVTLRRDQMYEFFDRLVTFALPRVRDFKGVSPKSFDGRGNYTLGVREEIIFPEINFEKLDKPKGMNITFNTSAANDEQGRALLKHLGMPFRN